MSNSDAKSEGGSQKKRKSRRRPVRRRKSSGDPSAQKKSKRRKQKTGSQSEKERLNEQARSQRRKRRRRRSSGGKKSETKRPEPIRIDYDAPESVFIYTHVVYKDQRDTLHQYRPDHFAHGGRQLDDFRIDLSPIMGTILEVEEGSKGLLNEFVWDDELDEETVYEAPEDADADAGSE